jgi:hypothetical protein
VSSEDRGKGSLGIGPRHPRNPFSVGKDLPVRLAVERNRSSSGCGIGRGSSRASRVELPLSRICLEPEVLLPPASKSLRFFPGPWNNRDAQGYSLNGN